jgi:hypothetical protein
MTELAENLAALGMEGMKSPRSRRGRRYGMMKHGAEPVLPEGCYARDLYYQPAAEVRATTVRFLDGRVNRKGFHRRAHCASFPAQNAWVDAVKAVADQTGLSAAESAALLRRQGAWPTGSAETRPSATRAYRQARQVKSPSTHQQRMAPLMDVSRAVAAGSAIAARRGVGAPMSPRARVSPRASMGRQSARAQAARQAALEEALAAAPAPAGGLF